MCFTRPLVAASVRVIAAFVTLGAFSSSVFAQDIQTDFDGDGQSERARVVIGSNSSLNWFSDSFVSGASVERGSFGKNGDHVIVARWQGQPVPEIGVVTYNTTRNKLVWKIKTAAGTELRKDFGTGGDMVISGADFNGNGFADAAIATLSGKQYTWSIWPDMFAPGAGGEETIVHIPFGNKNERLFFASPTGAGDWLGRVRKYRNNSSIVRLLHPFTGEEKTVKRFGAYAAQARPRPFPIKTAGGADVLGFETKVKNRTVFTFANLQGRKIGTRQFSGRPTSIVGDFLAGNGEEVGVETTKGWQIVSPFKKKVMKLQAAPGIPVDFININRFDTSSLPIDTPADEPPPSNVPLSACSRIVPWPSSHIYKIMGSSHFTDVRRNTYGVVIKPGGSGPHSSCISAVDTKGNLLGALGLYQRGGGWEARYYAGIGCGSTNLLGGRQLAAKARQLSGSPYVYMNFSGVCYGPIDANECIGSSQC